MVMRVVDQLRQLFIKLYFLCHLYILGFAEMITQLFEDVAYHSSIHGMDLSAKVAFVTGGMAVTRKLCSLGMTVCAAGPHPFTEDAKAELQVYIYNGTLLYIPLHLDSFHSIEESVTTFRTMFERLDYLINNAGIMLHPYFETEQGFEGHIGVNLLGHVKLTKLLLPQLNLSEHPRIVNVASSVHRIAPISLLFSGQFFSNLPFYSSHLAYAMSKLGIILYTLSLAQQLKRLNSKIQSYSVHPGIVASSLYERVCAPLQFIQRRLFTPLFFRTIDQGAVPIINCALVEHMPYETGCYIERGIGSIMTSVSPAEKDELWKIVGQQIHKTGVIKQHSL
ncbi:retinol dehydrogenase 12-like isoform X2 [Watersipora subatra]|uniref:retinol dehydrogenase 12-like isoform X2 n=1 Tax=Watersipora subatra TaxID=2589382 RepID=UPI00355B16D0